MGFADPHVCPSCRGRIESVTQCPRCHLDLTSHEVKQAWQALLVADQWIDRARSLRNASEAGTSCDASAATVATPQPRQQAPTVAPTQTPTRRPVSTGSVLLGLGALFLLVAGTIFISVSWGSLGLLGRALVLLAVTALIGVIGSFVTRRGLRASAEALWTVFFGLLTLDWFAARDQGLAGLDTLPFGASAAAWAAVVIGASLVVIRLGRKHLRTELLAASIVAGAAALFAAGSLGAEIDNTDTMFWPAVVATSVVAAVGLLLRREFVIVGSLICLVGVGVFGLLAVGSAVVDAVANPSLRELAVDAHGLPLLLVVGTAIVIGVVVDRVRWPASAVAVAGAATLVTLPVEAAWSGRGAYVVVAGLVAAGAWMVARDGDWFRGARLVVFVSGAGLALASAPWVGRLISVAAEGASASRTEDLTAPLAPDYAPETGPWWLAALVAAALAVAVVAARRWPETGPARSGLLPSAWLIGVVGALAVLATFDPPAVLIGIGLIAAGTLLTLLLPVDVRGWPWIGPAVVAIAPVTTISSWSAAVIVWPLAGVVLAVVARTRDMELRLGSSFVATAWSLGTTAAVLELVDGDNRWASVGLVVAALVGVAVAVFTVREHLVRESVAAASEGLGIVGLIMGSTTSTLGFASFVWTVAGAGAVVLGLASRRRPWYRWLGSGILGVAYVLRLAASEVEVVEAYTMPFAVLLLAAGLWAMRDSSAELRRPDPGTPADGPGSVRALLPGVALAMLPSLPQALDEPTGLRALLLGIGAAVALGIGTWRRWKVPFIAGAVVLALLVLVNVGPLTLALPRWMLIASVGAVLLAAGITWEDRVRDGRAVVRYVASMR